MARRIVPARLTTLALFAVASVLLLGAHTVHASVGDRLILFQDCMKTCISENCDPTKPQTTIPLLHRLLLWDCPSECDYTCQHITTAERIKYDLPIVQYHGKWPFRRFWGMQEPFSVLCSALNLWANLYGLRTQVRRHIPADYPMRRYYVLLAYVSAASWLASIVFHMRDFLVTEQADYFAAGANVLYGLYYAVVHEFGLAGEEKSGSLSKSVRKSGKKDDGGSAGKKIVLVEKSTANASTDNHSAAPSNSTTTLRIWTTTCLTLYALHVAYLKLYKWDYGYNMAANTTAGMLANIIWLRYSFVQYRRTGGAAWTLWPAVTVVWVMGAMSLELFDFAPLWGMVDAHSLWHLGTVAPTIWWYRFLVKDAQDDIARLGERTKR